MQKEINIKQVMENLKDDNDLFFAKYLPRTRRALQKGDTIKCHNADEMVELSTILSKEDIDNDFLYEKDGKKGFWIEIQ